MLRMLWCMNVAGAQVGIPQGDRRASLRATHAHGQPLPGSGV